MVETLALPDQPGNILSDQIGFLPARLARNRHNPMSDAVRKIKVRIDTGKILRVLTNDLNAPAQEIAELYKRRWAVELFFHWIKQSLKLRHLCVRSENAVRIQIIVAIIAFVLIRLAHLAYQGRETMTRFSRLIRATVLHRKPLERLGLPVTPNVPHVQSPIQGVLQ